MKTCIEVLASSRLQAILAQIGEGAMATTFLCNVLWRDGKLRRSYVKCFSTDQSLGVANEVTGYILARSCKLPIPSHAGLIEIPGQILQEHPSLSPWAFVCSEAPGKTPNTILSADGYSESQLKVMLDVLSRWDRLCETLAFDDWTANTDRHLGNILISSPRRFYLIDHSNLPVTLAWEASQLEPDSTFVNRLMLILDMYQSASDTQKASLLTACAEHAEAYKSCSGELRYWWNILLGPKTKRRRTIEAFMATRAQNGKDRLGASLNILPV